MKRIATHPRRSSPLPQHFRGANCVFLRRRRGRPAPIVAETMCKPLLCSRGLNCLLRKQNKIDWLIAACSDRAYMCPDHGHAAGALISMELPLGCAQPASLRSWHFFLVRRGIHEDLSLHFVAFAFIGAHRRTGSFTRPMSSPSVSPAKPSGASSGPCLVIEGVC